MPHTCMATASIRLTNIDPRDTAACIRKQGVVAIQERRPR